jgi:hypothetical protein
MTTARDWGRRLGRVALWIAVAIVGVRGLSSTFAAKPSPAAVPVKAPPAWPDQRAGAFAAQFAAAWLAVTPDVAAYRASLEPYADDSALEALPVADPKAKPVTVSSVTVASLKGQSEHSARVTVAADTSAGRVWVAARVDRDPAGHLVIVGAPALVAGPQRAQADPPDGEPLAGSLAEAQELAGRYVTAYVTGHPEALTYLVPPGDAPPVALTAGFAADGEPEITALGDVPDAPKRLDLLARVTVTDHAKARRTLTYRLGLQRTDRWYVDTIEGGA